MSSDSDEDFSYTNSASMLKAIKKDISFNEDKQAESLETADKLKDNTIELDDSVLDITNSNKNDSCIVLSDEELNQSTSSNLIETIDKIINKKQRRSRAKQPPATPIIDSGQRRTRSMTQQQSKVAPKKKPTRSISTPKQSRKSKRKSNEIILTPDLNNSEIVTEEDNIQDLNYEITLKVWWMSQYLQKFAIRRFDKVATIFEFFSKKEDIPENKLLFTIEKGGVILSKDDTPDSLNINAATIIEGGHRNRKSLIVTNTINNKDNIEFKVQFKDRKRPLNITMRRNDNMEVLMYKTASEIEVEVKRLKFYFDGDLIKSNDCIDDFQLEGGECIDCIKY